MAKTRKLENSEEVSAKFESDGESRSESLSPKECLRNPTIFEAIKGTDDVESKDLNRFYNGFMYFPYPWGCNFSHDSLESCNEAILDIFESSKPISCTIHWKNHDSDHGNFLILSWEGVKGSSGDGDVNVQARLFSDGKISFCFGCGALPEDISLTMTFNSCILYEEPGLQQPLGDDVDFDTWPTNQCFTWNGVGPMVD